MAARTGSPSPPADAVVAARLRLGRRPRPLRLVALRRPAPAQQPRRLLDRRHRGRGHSAGHGVGRRGGRRLRPRRRHGPAPAPARRRPAAARQPARRPLRGRATPTCPRPSRRVPRGSCDRRRSQRRRPGRPRLLRRAGDLRRAQPRRRPFLPPIRVGGPGVPLLFDYDNDGFLDLFVASPCGRLGALPRRRRGTARAGARVRRRVSGGDRRPRPSMPTATATSTSCW